MYYYFNFLYFLWTFNWLEKINRWNRIENYTFDAFSCGKINSSGEIFRNFPFKLPDILKNCFYLLQKTEWKKTIRKNCSDQKNRTWGKKELISPYYGEIDEPSSKNLSLPSLLCIFRFFFHPLQRTMSISFSFSKPVISQSIFFLSVFFFPLQSFFIKYYYYFYFHIFYLQFKNGAKMLAIFADWSVTRFCFVFRTSFEM